MLQTELSITTPDRLRLHVWRRESSEPRAEVIIVHGFGEHSGRYGPLTDHLLAHQFSVTSYDQRGHGRSEGLPGHINRFADYEEDLDRVISLAGSFDRARKLFIIGHSMGGLVTLRYVASRSAGLSGAVISAPLIGLAVRVPPHKLMIAKVGSHLMPRLRLPNEINPKVLSRDQEVGRAYEADPLVHRVVSTRWFAEADRAMNQVKAWADRVRLPVLVMHGSEDRLANVEATREVFNQIGSTDKELIIYPGYYHELFNEPEKVDLYTRVTDWLDERLG